MGDYRGPDDPGSAAALSRTTDIGLPDGQAPKRRKQKDTPSRRRREARRLARRIELTTAERHGAWAEGGQVRLTERLTTSLDALHHEKREMRREIYAAAPDLEGLPVFRSTPGGRS